MKNVVSYIQRVAGFLACMLVPAALLAQQAEAAAPAAEPVRTSPYTTPIFYALVVLAVVLLAFILILQRVFSSVARNYARGDRGKFSDMIKGVAILAGFSLMGTEAQAAEPATGAGWLSFLHDGFGSNAINALMFLIVVELIVVVYYARLILKFVAKEEEEKAYVPGAERVRPSFWEKFNKSVAVEREAEVMTDHDYDGIRELDNALPPWWKYGFYLTIVWSLVYLVHYHVAHSGPSSLEEYQTQLDEGNREVAEYLAKMGNMVDETNVKLLTDAGDISQGKEIYTQLCVACHGASGEGLVGPNLTDQYWKHGGDIKDLFKTVKYGVSGTGMKPWNTDLSPAKIAQVSSYILTLQGTNPANAKAPEGKLYAPADAAPADTTAAAPAPADTTAVAPK